MRKVQRLNGSGCLVITKCLRYSLLPRLSPNKYTEKWGIKVPTPTKREAFIVYTYVYNTDINIKSIKIFK